MGVGLDQTGRVEDGSGCGGADRLRGAGDVDHHPGLHRPGAHRPGVVVAGAGHHLGARVEPETLHQLGSGDAHDFGGIDDGWEQVGIDAEGVDQRIRPVPARDVVEHRRRGVGVVLGRLTGQPPGHHGRRRDQVGRGGVDVVEEPAHLGGAVGGVAVEPGQLVDGVAPDRRLDRGRLLGGAAVEPDDGGMERVEAGIGGDHPVDLGRHAKRQHRPGSLFGQGGHHLLDRCQPCRRVLLCPPGVGRVHGVGDGCGADGGARLVDQHPFGALGADVASDHVRARSHKMSDDSTHSGRTAPVESRGGLSRVQTAGDHPAPGWVSPGSLPRVDLRRR